MQGNVFESSKKHSCFPDAKFASETNLSQYSHMMRNNVLCLTRPQGNNMMVGSRPQSTDLQIESSIHSPLHHCTSTTIEGFDVKLSCVDSFSLNIQNALSWIFFSIQSIKLHFARKIMGLNLIHEFYFSNLMVTA